MKEFKIEFRKLIRKQVNSFFSELTNEEELIDTLLIQSECIQDALIKASEVAIKKYELNELIVSDVLFDKECSKYFIIITTDEGLYEYGEYIARLV